MIIGTTKEIKDNEYRVGLVPAGVQKFVNDGHKVLVEKNAGIGSGIDDKEYKAAGAQVIDSAKEVFAKADMVMKVKEPLKQEWDYLHEGKILYTYLHLAPDVKLTNVLLERKVTGIAYETIQLEDGSLPLLTPMSEVAGRMAVQVGATYLEKINGGIGILLGGVPGVPPAEVVIIGAGIVGMNAAKMALGLGARVTILEMSVERMRYIDDIFKGQITTLMSNNYNLETCLRKVDLLIGAVLIPGASAPKIVKRGHLKLMKKRSIIVDVAVDQGGCIETTKATSHSNPVYEVDGIIHYCVANMPGAVPRTSTFALTNATFPYALEIANNGFVEAIKKDTTLMKGVNVYKGKITYQAVADSQNQPYTDLYTLI
jgi:alanine dehydrogenase